MPSSYTTSLRLTLPATGELTGTWGTTVNTGITELLDSAVAGTTTISTWGGAGVPYTLSNTDGAADEARRMFIVASGAPGEAKNVICPAVSKLYFFRNDTTGGFALTLKTSGGSGIAVPAGQYKVLYCNGTNVVEAFNSLASLTLGTALAASSGGTGQSTYTTGDLLYASGASALSKLGIGTNGQILTSTGTAPQWSTLSGVAVTTFSAGTTGFTPSTATSGAVTLGGTLATTNGGTGLTSFTSGGVVYASSSSALTTGSALTFDGTNLGLGTASPAVYTANSRLLQIDGGANAAEFKLTNSTTGSAGTDGTLFQLNGSAFYLWNLENSFLSFGVNNAEQMRLTSTGLGIGATPLFKLDVQGASGLAFRLMETSTGNNNRILISQSGTETIYNSTYSTGSASQVWQVGASEQMRLTSTGLGIGTSSPQSKFVVSNAGAQGIEFGYSAGLSANFLQSINRVGGADVNMAYYLAGGGSHQFYNNGTLSATLNSSGNLGLGVTPSAWNTDYKAIQVGVNGSISGRVSTSNTVDVTSNGFRNTSGNWQYIATNPVARFSVDGSLGGFQWYTAPSGTAGNAISFTQAMTLDASGNLGVGVTSISGFKLDVLSSSTDAAIRARTSNNNEVLRVESAGTATSSIRFINTSVNNTYISADGTALSFLTGGSERARITSGGDLLVGTTAQPSGASSRQVVKYDTSDYVSYFWNANASPYGVRVQHDTDVNGTGNPFLICVGNATERASIRSNGGLANYSGNDVNLSDRREKTNFAPAKSYLDTICAIPVQTFEYIDQSPDDPGLTLGVVAQDVQAVAPELVMESNWGTEDNPKMRLSIYQTDLQYALMKCIQELKAQNDELRARVAALESQP